MSLKYNHYDSAWVARLRAGGPDDYGNPAEESFSDGSGNPCRYCLCDIPAGAGMLSAAARPFPAKQPYAETGPIFLCATDCAPYQSDALPPILKARETALIKGYAADHRIVYGTGAIVPVADLAATCEAVLEDAKVAFVDVRSSTNNCFTFRITRADESPL